jgi:hypothetical protein
MAEPRPTRGPLQVHVDYWFDRLHDSKLVQAYGILVPVRERPVGSGVKEFDHEDGGNLRPSRPSSSAAGPLRSTAITPSPRYYWPLRHPLAILPFPGVAGYRSDLLQRFLAGTRRASPVA